MTTARPRIPYVQSSASLQSPPPYSFPGVTVNSFVFEVSMARAQRYCDRFLNIGPEEERDYVYRPLAAWPYASLQFLQYPKMISIGPDDESRAYANRGTISQNEVFVAMPVVRYGKGARILTHSALEWALPFIVVDNPLSSICGREMLGMGKLIAKIDLPPPSDHPGRFHAEVRVPGWNPDTRETYQSQVPVVSVITQPPLPTHEGNPPSTSLASLFQSAAASRMIGAIAGLGDLVETASLGLVPTAMRTVGLKQYRDAGNLKEAVYQALVTCRARYSNVRDFRFYNERDVTLEFHDVGSSNFIMRSLFDVGKEPSETPFEQPVKAASRFVADIDFDEMRVLYQPPTGRDGKAAAPRSSDTAATWFRSLQGFFGPRR